MLQISISPYQHCRATHTHVYMYVYFVLFFFQKKTLLRITLVSKLNSTMGSIYTTHGGTTPKPTKKTTKLTRLLSPTKRKQIPISIICTHPNTLFFHLYIPCTISGAILYLSKERLKLKTSLCILTSPNHYATKNYFTLFLILMVF